jgi:MFS family permease
MRKTRERTRRSPPAARYRWLPDFRGLPGPFWVLFAGTLLNRTGGFVLVFLGIYLTEVRGLTPAQAGYVVAAFGCGALAGAPLGGALSDRLGRRPPLVVSLIGGGASMAALGFVAALPSIVVVAAVTGLLYEMYRPIVSAVIADIVVSADRPRAYTLNYWAINIGAAIAPPLGALIAARSYPVLFAADGVTTALYGLLVWFALPETRPVSPVQDEAVRVGARTVLRDRTFMTMCVLTFGVHLVFFQAFVALPVDMRAHGISTAAFGALMTINPVLIVLFQPWAGEVSRHRSPLLVMSIASFLIGVGFGLNAWAGATPAYVAAILLFTVGEILFAPASMSFVADLAPAALRGGYQGVFAVAVASAFAGAPALGGHLMTAAGARWLWIACLATGCGVSAGFLLMRGRH